MRKSWIAVGALVGVALSVNAPAVHGQARGQSLGQLLDQSLGQSFDPRLVRADSIYHAGDATGSLEILRSMVDPGTDADPATRYEALWRAARANVSLGVLAEGISDWRVPYGEAQEYAARARELDPTRLEAAYWDIAAKGRVAIRAGAVEASNLAESVRSEAHRILALEPSHAGAHNALGRLYFQVLTLPWAYRQVARVLAGRAAISEATWERAESYLAKAVALDPTMVLFRLDLGRFYVERERWNEARTTLTATEAMPFVHPADAVFRRQASELRAGIR